MKEYIERDCFKCFHYPVCKGDTDKHNYFGECKHFTPAADVEPVRHGEWIGATEAIGTISFNCVKCSVCEDKWIMDEDYDLDFYKEQWAYCPFCGAKMDGVNMNIKEKIEVNT